jgi:hypothetical protein
MTNYCLLLTVQIVGLNTAYSVYCTEYGLHLDHCSEAEAYAVAVLRCRNARLTTHLHLMLKLRLSGAVKGQHYFFFFSLIQIRRTCRGMPL